MWQCLAILHTCSGEAKSKIADRCVKSMERRALTLIKNVRACMWLYTTEVYNTAQGSSNDFPSYPPDKSSLLRCCLYICIVKQRVQKQQTLRTLVAHLGSSLNCGRRENSSWTMSTKVCSEDLRRSSARCRQFSKHTSITNRQMYQVLTVNITNND